MRKLEIILKTKVPTIGMNFYGDSDQAKNWESVTDPRFKEKFVEQVKKLGFIEAGFNAFLDLVEVEAYKMGLPGKAIRETIIEDEPDEFAEKVWKHVHNKYMVLEVTDLDGNFLGKFIIEKLPEEVLPSYERIFTDTFNMIAENLLK